MKILLLGKNGQLGKEFVHHFQQNNIQHIALGREDCDISDRDSIAQALKDHSVDTIINATGYVFVDKAEGEGRDLCFTLNRDAVHNISEIASEKGIRVVHFSTDYVFDGKKEVPYVEDDATHPLNVYGQSKAEGEKAVSSFENTLTLRTSWLYGEGNNNFIHKFLGFASQKDLLPMTFDEVSVPTSTEVLMDITMKALAQNLHGLYHLTNSGHASRIEFAQEILNIMEMKEKTLEPIPMSHWRSPVTRPTFSAMSNEKIATLLGLNIPTWQESLRRYLSS